MTYAPDLTTAALKMVFSLALVLAVVWMLYRWARRALPAGVMGADSRLVKVLASHHLGVKKSIMVVQVPGSVLVLGIGAEQVNLLSRIDDPNLIAGLAKVEETVAGVGFREQLDRLMRPLRGKSNSAVAAQEKRVAR
jgi:flagellar protein FliO/FliZ